MSEKDKQLIVSAGSAADYFVIFELEDQAESQEAKDILHDMSVDAYRRDEYRF